MKNSLILLKKQIDDLSTSVQAQTDLDRARSLAVETVRSSLLFDRKSVERMLRAILETHTHRELVQVLQETGDRLRGME